jgi:hypothetical protein
VVVAAQLDQVHRLGDLRQRLNQCLKRHGNIWKRWMNRKEIRNLQKEIALVQTKVQTLEDEIQTFDSFPGTLVSLSLHKVCFLSLRSKVSWNWSNSDSYVAAMALEKQSISFCALSSISRMESNGETERKDVPLSSLRSRASTGFIIGGTP